MSVQRNIQTIVTLTLVDASNRPTRKSGVTFAASDTNVSKDGGSFANTTNVPVEIGSSGRYALTLTAAEMDAAWVHVTCEASGCDPCDVQIGTDGSPSGTVVSDAGNTATTFKADRTESVTDHWKDALLLFTSGALVGQVKRVSAFNPTTDFITVSSAFTAAPSAGDRFLLVNR